MAATPRIQFGDADGVLVARFLDRQIFDDLAVRQASDQLFAALPADGAPIRLILDFQSVEMFSSSMLGKLILLQRRVDASGGLLRFCEMKPSLTQVLKTTNLDRLFTVTRDRREAREAFGQATDK
jgi:anti-sigma B factor antagonist